MRYRLRTLLTQFTIRDLLWVTTVIALVVVWRSDLARQEAVYRNMLGGARMSPDLRWISVVAKHHPELLSELNAFEADRKKHASEGVSLYFRFDRLATKAKSLYRSDTGNDPIPIVFFDDEKPAADPFGTQSK